MRKKMCAQNVSNTLVINCKMAYMQCLIECGIKKLFKLNVEPKSCLNRSMFKDIIANESFIILSNIFFTRGMRISKATEFKRN